MMSNSEDNQSSIGDISIEDVKSVLSEPDRVDAIREELESRGNRHSLIVAGIDRNRSVGQSDNKSSGSEVDRRNLAGERMGSSLSSQEEIQERGRREELNVGSVNNVSGDSDTEIDGEESSAHGNGLSSGTEPNAQESSGSHDDTHSNGSVISVSEQVAANVTVELESTLNGNVSCIDLTNEDDVHYPSYDIDDGDVVFERAVVVNFASPVISPVNITEFPTPPTLRPISSSRHTNSALTTSAAPTSNHEILDPPTLHEFPLSSLQARLLGSRGRVRRPTARRPRGRVGPSNPSESTSLAEPPLIRSRSPIAQRSHSNASNDDIITLPNSPNPFSLAKHSNHEKQSSSASNESHAFPPRRVIRCPVCLDEDNQISLNGKTLVSTTCGHIFCDSCIKEVIKSSKICPQCRKKLTAKGFHPIYI